MASRKRYRYTFEVVFPSEEQKTLFSDRVEGVRRKVEATEGGKKLNNFDLLSRLLAMVEAGSEPVSVVSEAQESRNEKLMNENAAVLDVQSKCIQLKCTVQKL